MKHKKRNAESLATFDFIGKCVQRLLQNHGFIATKIDEIVIVRYGYLDVAVPQARAKAVNGLFSQRLWLPLHLVPRKNLDRFTTQVLSIHGSLIYSPRRRNMRSQQWHF